MPFVPLCSTFGKLSGKVLTLVYTATTPTIHNRISRFTASGDVALAGSETIIMELPALSAATNHNGGALHFGPDGTLFVAVGDNAIGSLTKTTPAAIEKEWLN